ncbi:MAG: hypothetical protein M3429_03405, partial [Verrucomicrobiota bacterium]|nr:hypothetical protein [Verrucomicrobiota bacterium]
MRKFIAPLGAPFFACAILIACGSAHAQENSEAQPGAETAVEVSQSTETGQSAEVTTPQLGTGNFSPSPFRVSISVREGYDDNVYT